MLQNPLGAHTVLHWVSMDAKVHNGESELEFNLQKPTAEIYDMGKINGKGFPDNIKILLRENSSSSLYWDKKEAPKVPSTHPSIHSFKLKS